MGQEWIRTGSVSFLYHKLCVKVLVGPDTVFYRVSGCLSLLPESPGRADRGASAIGSCLSGAFEDCCVVPGPTLEETWYYFAGGVSLDSSVYPTRGPSGPLRWNGSP